MINLVDYVVTKISEFRMGRIGAGKSDVEKICIAGKNVALVKGVSGYVRDKTCLDVVNDERSSVFYDLDLLLGEWRKECGDESTLWDNVWYPLRA
jgi:hypothetical protein